LPLNFYNELYRRNALARFITVGGATGMVGDPTDKADERTLLYEEELNKNIAGIHQQLKYLLEKAGGEGNFVMANNYDWMKDYSFLNFIRDIGKHMTVYTKISIAPYKWVAAINGAILLPVQN